MVLTKTWGDSHAQAFAPVTLVLARYARTVIQDRRVLAGRVLRESDSRVSVEPQLMTVFVTTTESGYTVH